MSILRPACLDDIICDVRVNDLDPMGKYQQAWEMAVRDLRDLYDAEWRKRGFLRSP